MKMRIKEEEKKRKKNYAAGTNHSRSLLFKWLKTFQVLPDLWSIDFIMMQQIYKNK